MHASKPPLHARQRPLRRVEYEKLAALGAFRDEKVELVYGRILEMSPQGHLHRFSIVKLSELLIRALGDRASVHVQAPFIAGDNSEPEPDVAIVPRGDYLEAHPDRAHLVVEVAESSLTYDRVTKGSVYADSGVPEYWIVNLVNMVLEVNRDPKDGVYSTQQRLGRGDSIAIPSFEDIVLQVAAFLPPAKD